jgi:hypothetical protein
MYRHGLLRPRQKAPETICSGSVVPSTVHDEYDKGSSRRAVSVVRRGGAFVDAIESSFRDAFSVGATAEVGSLEESGPGSMCAVCQSQVLMVWRSASRRSLTD